MNAVARLLFLFLIVIPLVSWFFVKPVRVVAPNSDLLVCEPRFICLEQVHSKDIAAELYESAYASVAQKLGEFEKKPVFIFCSTSYCNDYFGLGKRSAITFGSLGTVIGSNAWKQHYVEHELIHYQQYQNLGYLGVLTMPTWLKEGMAYSISTDPRNILGSPWQEHRARFTKEFSNYDKSSVWQKVSDE